MVSQVSDECLAAVIHPPRKDFVIVASIFFFSFLFSFHSRRCWSCVLCLHPPKLDCNKVTVTSHAKGSKKPRRFRFWLCLHASTLLRVIGARETHESCYVSRFSKQSWWSWLSLNMPWKLRELWPSGRHMRGGLIHVVSLLKSAAAARGAIVRLCRNITVSWFRSNWCGLWWNETTLEGLRANLRVFLRILCNWPSVDRFFNGRVRGIENGYRADSVCLKSWRIWLFQHMKWR